MQSQTKVTAANLPKRHLSDGHTKITNINDSGSPDNDVRIPLTYFERKGIKKAEGRLAYHRDKKRYFVFL